MHKQAPQDAAGVCRRARGFRCPGLANPESQLGVPLLVRGELVGVLCLESEVPYRFHEEDKASIELLGSYLAIADPEHAAAGAIGGARPTDATPAPAPPPGQAAGRRRRRARRDATSSTTRPTNASWSTAST